MFFLYISYNKPDFESLKFDFTVFIVIIWFCIDFFFYKYKNNYED